MLIPYRDLGNHVKKNKNVVFFGNLTLIHANPYPDLGNHLSTIKLLFFFSNFTLIDANPNQNVLYSAASLSPLSTQIDIIEALLCSPS